MTTSTWPKLPPVFDQEVLKKLGAAASAPSDRISTTYIVELLTPMMGGGVVAGEVDAAMPFRARSIRGHLRAWWRIAKRIQVSESPGRYPELKDATSDQWRKAEFSIWGGPGTPAGENGATVPPSPSRIGVSVRLVRRPTVWPEDKEFTDPLKYAYFPASEGKEDAPNAKPTAAKTERRRKPVMGVWQAGGKFELTVTCPAELTVDADLAVSYWATFGGIGARVNRGVGAIWAKRKVDNQALCEFGSDVKEPGSNAEKYGLELGDFMSLWFLGDPGKGATRFRTADEAHRAALRKLWQFRQAPGTGRAGVPKSPGMSFWPEAHSARVLLQQYLKYHAPPDKFEDHASAPRAVFGLPLPLVFTHGRPILEDKPNSDPGKRAFVPVDEAVDRMASPLILRPIALPLTAGENEPRFVAAAILLNRELLEKDVPGRGLPKAARLTRGDNTGPIVDVRVPKIVDWPLDVSSYGGAFSPATNALEMFINHFVSSPAANPTAQTRPHR